MVNLKIRYPEHSHYFDFGLHIFTLADQVMCAYSLEDSLDYKQLFYRLFIEFYCQIVLALGLNTCMNRV